MSTSPAVFDVGENAAHVVAVQRILANTAITPDTSHDVPGIRDLLTFAPPRAA